MDRLHTFSLAELERLFLDFFMELVAVSASLLAVISGPVAGTYTIAVTTCRHPKAEDYNTDCSVSDRVGGS
jgi:hypothetical protein